VLTGYIDEHTLIGEAQAGFRTGRNTNTNYNVYV
jgi:hypothetical protein